ncbi:MAG TPA: 50S ribosomal protein L9 [Vicinamibacterales bacterium]|nr:50S ribosomal protein L9 [Vicinamibacterales bacterium]
MEVILRDHVENVGKRGEVVKVAAGYARNYLLPRKLALIATPGNMKQIARERVKADAQEAVERTACEEIASRMSGIQVVVSRKVGETGALYGSVTSADIAEALAKQGFEIDKRKIGLREPIKKLGEKTVPVKLHPTVVVQMPVRVVAEGKPEPALAPAAEKTE